MIIWLTVGLIRKIYKMISFSEPYSDNENKIKVELDLSNYATKSDSKEETDIDTTKFAKICKI